MVTSSYARNMDAVLHILPAYTQILTHAYNISRTQKVLKLVNRDPARMYGQLCVHLFCGFKYCLFIKGTLCIILNLSFYFL